MLTADAVRPRLKWVAWLWATWAVHLVWVGVLAPGVTPEWRSVISNLMFLPAFALGAALTLRSARQPGRPGPGSTARLWHFLGWGLALWGAGQVAFTVTDNVLHWPTFPGLADVGFLGALVAFGRGLGSVERRPMTRMQTLSLKTDTALIILMVGAVMWQTSVRSLLSAPDASPLSLLISLAYPAGDLTLFALVVALLLWHPPHLGGRTLILIMLGLISLLISDLIFAARTAQGGYLPSTLLDAGWTLAPVLIGTAACIHRSGTGLLDHLDGPPTFTRRLRDWWPVLPHYAVQVAFLLYLWRYLTSPEVRSDPAHQLLLALIGLVFFTRQWLMLTDNHSLHRRLTHQAEHDPLTGARNRLDMEAMVQERIDAHQAGSRTLAVLFIDLDRMKLINDTFGHRVGDRVLRVIATRLQSVLRPGDLLFRFGGDEFVLVLCDLDGHEQAARLAEQLLGLIAEPVAVGGEVVGVTGSLGIALAPLDTLRAAQAIELADTAMYRVKESGRTTWSYANLHLHSLHAPLAQVEVQLRGALQRGEFSVHYQPLIALDTGRVEGFEALLRWHSPVLGVVPPSDFIPLAEERGMLGGIGRWVLREALRAARDWRAGPLGGVHVAVNISARQFDTEDFVTDVRAALDEFGLPAGALVLELTESAVLHHMDLAARKMQALRDLGVGLALDDFGMGYSSLGHLRQLPVNVVKIDRSFIREMHADQATFVQAIIQLTLTLGLRVVAEGIEDEETAERLRQLRCDVGQGYHFGRPLPALEAVAAVRARNTSGSGVSA